MPPVAAKSQRQWIVRVNLRVREKFLPVSVVTVGASSIYVAVGRGVQEARKKIGGPRRKIYEITVNVKPVVAAMVTESPS